MQELLAQPQILKYKPLWEGAETDPSPAVAALSRDAFFNYACRSLPQEAWARWGTLQTDLHSVVQQGLLEGGLQDPARRAEACAQASATANQIMKTCITVWQSGQVTNPRECVEALMRAKRYCEMLECNPQFLAACKETPGTVNSKAVQVGTWLATLKRAGWNFAAVPCPVTAQMPMGAGAGAGVSAADAEFAAFMAAEGGGAPAAAGAMPQPPFAPQQQQQFQQQPPHMGAGVMPTPGGMGVPSYPQQLAQPGLALPPQGFPGMQQQPQGFPGMQQQQPQGFPGMQQQQQPQGFPGSQQQQGFPGMQQQQPQGFPGMQQLGGFPTQQPGGFPPQQQPGGFAPSLHSSLPASSVPTGLGPMAEGNPALRACIGHAQQAIAALRVHNLAEAQAEIAACQQEFGACVRKPVGQPMTALLSAHSPAAQAQAEQAAAARLRLFISAVRWQQLEHAVGYLGQVGAM